MNDHHMSATNTPSPSDDCGGRGPNAASLVQSIILTELARPRKCHSELLEQILLAQDGEFASHAAASVRPEDPFDTIVSARLWRNCCGRLDMPEDLLRPIPGELRLLSFWHDDDPKHGRASRGEQDPASAVLPASLLTISVLTGSRQADPGTKADWNDRDAGTIVEAILRPRLVLQPEHESIGYDLATASIMPIAAHVVEQSFKPYGQVMKPCGLLV